jgi:transposase-like protein
LGGEIKNISVLVAIGVSHGGYRDIIGIAEGTKEDKEGWSNFLKYLKARGLSTADLFISDTCMGLVESLGEYFPETRWQQCSKLYMRRKIGERL